MLYKRASCSVLTVGVFVRLFREMRCQRTTFFIVTILSVLHTTRSKPTQNDSAINLDHMGPMIYGRPSDEAGRQLIRWHLNKRPGNAEEQGNYFEGDILFPNSMLRNGLRSESHRWKDGIVPVEIEKTFCECPEKF